MLPNFIIIGAQRCATSWMYFCLKEHPDIFLPFIKELQFFNRQYENGLEWYKRYFNIWDGEKAVGEISPGYLHDEKTAGLIARHLKDIRLIACLRNPIERAYSQYKKNIRADQDLGSFEDAIEKYPVFIKRGFYFTNLTRYLDFFPKENMLILVYEDIQKDPLVFLTNIFRFLEVDTNFIPSCYNSIIPSENLTSVHNYAQRISSFLRDRMRLSGVVDTFKNSPAQKIIDRAFKSNISYKVRPQKSKPVDNIPMEEDTRIRLREIFKDENRKLASFINRDLSSWI